MAWSWVHQPQTVIANADALACISLMLGNNGRACGQRVPRLAGMFAKDITDAEESPAMSHRDDMYG